MTDYYVSDSQGTDEGEGTDINHPWKTLSYVTTKLSSMPAASRVLFKRGDTWTDDGTGINVLEVISLSSLTFSDYGDALLTLPTFTSRNAVNIFADDERDNWTEVSANTWKYNLTCTRSTSRVWLDGITYPIGDVSAIGQDAVEVSSSCRYWPTTKIVYVYSIGNPVDFYNTFEITKINSMGTLFSVSSSSNCTFERLKLDGGAPYPIWITNPDGVVVRNCNIGSASRIGLIVTTPEGDSMPSLSITVQNCVFDSGLQGDYTTSQSQNVGYGMLISLSSAGTQHTDTIVNVHDNIFTNWPSVSIGLLSSASPTCVLTADIKGNDISQKDVASGMAFSYINCPGLGTLDFAFNNIHDVHAGLRIMTSRANIYYNNIYRIRYDKVARDGGTEADGQSPSAILLLQINEVYVSDNHILNNTIYDCDGAGIEFYFIYLMSEVPGNYNTTTIANNIFCDCGKSYPYRSPGTGCCFYVQDTTTPLAINNIFKNNCFYSSNGITNLITYAGTTYTVGEFNDLTGTDENVISGNFLGNPQFADGPGGDLRILQPAPSVFVNFSPVRGTGINAGFGLQTVDYYGVAVPQDSRYDVGSNETVDPADIISIDYKSFTDSLGNIQTEWTACLAALTSMRTRLPSSDAPTNNEAVVKVEKQITTTYNTINRWCVANHRSLIDLVGRFQKIIYQRWGSIDWYLNAQGILVKHSFADLSSEAGYPISPVYIES